MNAPIDTLPPAEPATTPVEAELPPPPSIMIRMLRTVRVWFDSHSSMQSEADGRVPLKVDWLRLLPFIGVHFACLSVYWVGWSWVAVGVALGMYVLRMFAITGFYHRYFSHRTFTTSRVMQFLMGCMGNSSVQRGPLWWAAHHRHHHKYSDKPEDSHSPRQHGFWWAHVGWISAHANFRTDMKSVPDLAKYPELVLLDRFDTTIPILLGVGMFFLGYGLNMWWPELGTSGGQMLVWGFFISTVAVAHGTFTVNSLTHIWGKQDYPSNDDSKNSLLIALITLGEGWHNNHHYYQSTVRQGFRWWQIDITYYGLWMMSKLGLIWNLKPVPAKVVADRGKLLEQEPAA